ncbi:AraC family transcriptional regulator [Cytophaga hutchinsonii]|uniref:Transcriptional regulator, AraC family n=1 Tax=Cytophaga hutchinsonii (strain ATCC 33406 / DSM 1761 / CIP 103989 / NBRC 15051 / NCIMB 9469 / D465) TaxID=269798 RepID=A0A6N4SQZ6_CYTH3|nr:helix-turn-helix domain-containing protein [Cytophaga hutchinsonii]ABG58771.1 transcriptional regulator, AraC family [Cytophaga hutchinsonii ATCC 33406]SFX61439.1 transcriptional regulator, AraC family [Cytophaga hutchinsonii ATCC 33406]
MNKEIILHIKNMVCPRCIKVVTDELTELGINTINVSLGKVQLTAPVSNESLFEIKKALEKNGFELLDDKKSKVIEQIKILIIEGIRDGKFSEMHINLSQYINDQVQMEYSYLSNLFSSVEGKTIERFVILQKIERIKELISYDELSIKEIAGLLGYSSLQALSNQFKKETGMNPRDFKKISADVTRNPINDI